MIVALLVTFLVLFLVLYLIGMLPLDPQAMNIARIVVIIIAIISLLRFLPGGPIL